MAIHEIGHALGLKHEQSRPDRDSHVTVHFENIEDGREGNFEKEDDEDILDEWFSYDMDSRMHYGRTQFCKKEWYWTGTTMDTRCVGPTITANDNYSRNFSGNDGDSSGSLRSPAVPLPGAPTARSWRDRPHVPRQRHRRARKRANDVVAGHGVVGRPARLRARGRQLRLDERQRPRRARRRRAGQAQAGDERLDRRGVRLPVPRDEQPHRLGAGPEHHPGSDTDPQAFGSAIDGGDILTDSAGNEVATGAPRFNASQGRVVIMRPSNGQLVTERTLTGEGQGLFGSAILAESVSVTYPPMTPSALGENPVLFVGAPQASASRSRPSPEAWSTVTTARASARSYGRR